MGLGLGARPLTTPALHPGLSKQSPRPKGGGNCRAILLIAGGRTCSVVSGQGLAESE